MKKLALFGMVLIMACMTQASLIAHYTMEETSGAIVDQVGGQTADPVDSGQIYGVTGGPCGNAVGLNANGAWQLDETEAAELNGLLNNFTVAAWIYVDSALQATKTGLNAFQDRIMGDDEAWDRDGWAFGINNGELLFTKNGVADVFSGITVQTDQWIHVAAVVSSTAGVEFYLNGTLTGTIANTADCKPGDDLFAIGRSYGNSQSQWFAGSLDEVQVYDEVLSASAIANLAVPEPATMVLLGLGGLMLRRKR